MPYIDELDTFYRASNIYSTHFRCVHNPSCTEAAARQNRPKQEAKSSFVGSMYGFGELPRVVFLSLDPGNTWYCPDPKDRTPEAIRAGEEAEDNCPNNPHWKGTLVLALHIYNEFGKLCEVKEEIAHLTNGQLRHGRTEVRPLVKVKPYIGHVNTAKCCANPYEDANGAHPMKVAPNTFFNNCHPFALQELEILEPHVIVTQGREVADQMRTFIGNENEELTDFPNDRIRVVKISGRKNLWLRTHHPASPHFQFWTEGCNCGRNDWCEYTSAVKSFMTVQRERCTELVA